jgi:hypothetical protein
MVDQSQGQQQGEAEQRGQTLGYFFWISDSKSTFSRLAIDASQAKTSAISFPTFSFSPRR